MSISSVLATMTAATGGMTASPYTAQVNQYTSIIADDSNASDDEKLTAYKWLMGVLPSGALYQAGNAADLEKAYDASTNSAFAKKVMAIGDRYMNAGVAAGRAAQASSSSDDFVGGNPISAFSRFSEDDQKILFVALGLHNQYSSIDEAYDDFQRQSDELVAKYQASKKPSVEVSLSDEAKALLGSEAVAKATATPVGQALARLKAGASSTDKGAVALTMLQNAAEARTAAQADEAKDSAKSSGDSAKLTADSSASKSKAEFPYLAGAYLDEMA